MSGQSLPGIRQISTTPVEYFQTLNDPAAGLHGNLKEGDVLLTLKGKALPALPRAWLEGQTMREMPAPLPHAP